MLVLLYPSPLGITESRYRLFISLSHLDNFVYTSQLWIFVYIPVMDFLFIPVVDFLFIPVIFLLFI